MANSVIFGVFSTKTQVETAVAEMNREGFRHADISVLFPYNVETKDVVLEKGREAAGGASAGATPGAVIGGTLGWLAGTGMLAIPGLGPLIAAGPLMALFGCVGVGAAVGGLAGALIGMGISHHIATRDEGRIKGGCMLLSVHADDSKWIQKAKTILESNGAVDISSTGELRAISQTPTRIKAGRAPSALERN